MEATLLLANSAEPTPTGTVSALGIGWSMISTPTPPVALVILIKVPWDVTNVKHELLLKLVDADGHDVMLGVTPFGDPAPLEIRGEFEVGRPAGLPHGTAIDQAMPINVGAGLPLVPGLSYEWRLIIDGEERAARSFLVRAAT
jgi:hypothetical protein